MDCLSGVVPTLLKVLCATSAVHALTKNMRIVASATIALTRTCGPRGNAGTVMAMAMTTVMITGAAIAMMVSDGIRGFESLACTPATIATEYAKCAWARFPNVPVKSDAAELLGEVYFYEGTVPAIIGAV